MQPDAYYGCSAGCANCPRRLQCLAAAETPLEVFLRENPDQGILRIQAFRGPQTYPMEGVEVTVSHAFADGTEHVFYTGSTDESGLIDPIPLPAPARANSLKPEQANPDAVYTVRVEADGFLPFEATVDIFQGIKTIQPIQLQLRME